MFLCLLLLLSPADIAIDIGPNHKVLVSRTWEITRSYLSRPGNVIQSLRKLPDWVKQDKINQQTIKQLVERTRRIREDAVSQADGSRTAYYIFQYIKQAIAYINAWKDA